MPLSDRDYIRGEHPPSCTCVECANKRLGINNVQRSNTNEKRRGKDISGGNRNWFRSCLLVLFVSLVGLWISIYIGTSIPFWILFIVAIKMTLIYNLVMEVSHGKKDEIYTGGDFKRPVTEEKSKNYRGAPESIISIVDDGSRS